MTKHEFVSFVSGELRQDAVRFSLAFNSKGEIVLHWTNRGRFGKRTILYGCVIAVGCTPTLYGLWQTFREMR